MDFLHASLLPNPVGTIYGLPVVLSPDNVPKMQLSEDCPVTPEFRIEMNQWMREFFGCRSLVNDGQVLRFFPESPSEYLMMNRRTWKKLRDHLEPHMRPAAS